MKTPLGISLRNVRTKKLIEDIIKEKAAKLEQVCDRIISCRVVVEQPSDDQRHTNHPHILVELKVPQHHEIVVKRELKKKEDLAHSLRQIFVVVRRQLQEIEERQYKNAKKHIKNPLKKILSADDQEPDIELEAQMKME